MKIYKVSDLERCLKVFAFRNKYDMMSNDIVSVIFDKIKTNPSNQIFSYDNIQVEINKEFINSTFENFHIEAFSENNVIHLIISLNNDFSEKDYQRLNFVLYEVIRHELEHVDKFTQGKFPNEEYVKLYNSLIENQNAKERAQKVSQYILSDVEVDSYVKSIMYVAKKQNKSVLEVIEQVIKRAFFNNNSKLMERELKDDEIFGIIESTRKILRGKLKEYYPNFKEKWL